MNLSLKIAYNKRKSIGVLACMIVKKNHHAIMRERSYNEYIYKKKNFLRFKEIFFYPSRFDLKFIIVIFYPSI